MILDGVAVWLCLAQPNGRSCPFHLALNGPIAILLHAMGSNYLELMRVVQRGSPAWLSCLSGIRTTAPHLGGHGRQALKPGMPIDS